MIIEPKDCKIEVTRNLSLGPITLLVVSCLYVKDYEVRISVVSKVLKLTVDKETLIQETDNLIDELNDVVNKDVYGKISVMNKNYRKSLKKKVKAAKNAKSVFSAMKVKK